ncbi:MAG: MarR family transcriptional regulator [Candidatus Eremiobacteraeota bacterium]|nr:MarR family transcriptional regulator [Candidatus Eremiobacteraeota bacterium]
MSSQLATTADRLHSTAIHLLRFVRQVDAESGLTGPRLSLLSVLVFGGDRTITELAEAEGVRAPTMTRLIDGLERDGYVKRKPEPRDARVTRVVATAKGRSTLTTARRRRIVAIESILEQLDNEQLSTIAQAAGIIERLLRRTSPRR